MSPVTFYVIPESSYAEREVEIVRALVLKKNYMLYVSTFKTPAEISSRLGSLGPHALFVAKKGPSTSNLFFTLEDYCSLSELSIVLNKVMRKKKISVLFFDSFCDLTVTNSSHVCKKFFIYLKNHLALQDIDFVAASKDNESSSRLLPFISDQIDPVNFERESTNIYKQRGL